MTNWWKETVVYQIYPRSFKDTNGDGVGDIYGIIEKLDYVSDLGVGAIWLSPVYASPNEDNGYDISDYKKLNPDFGTMEEMEKLIAEAKKRGIKIIMDLVINHTSIEHEWFKKSRENDEQYKDYYIWQKGKGKKPPNNWTSFFGGSCWEYDEKRQEYYLHLFGKGQPDLNYHNPMVIEEIKEIMRFWLDKGIGGFRCDAINVLYKSSLKNGRKKLILTGSEYFLTQQGTHDILHTLKTEVLNDYDCFTVGETALITPKQGRELSDVARQELDMIFTFDHMAVDQYFVKWFPRKFRPKKFFKAITKWTHELEWCANYLENHDQPRCVSRFGDEKRYHDESAKMLAVLLLTLKGTPFIYQGQEIGMTNYNFKSLEEINDAETHSIMRLAKLLHIPEFYRWKMIKRGCRDHARTPMQWSADKNAGFTKGTPWLNVNENYLDINTEIQVEDNDSILNFYQNVINFRSTSVILKKGEFEVLKMTSKVFAYKRTFNEKSLTVVLNFTGRKLKNKFTGKVLMSNYPANEEGTLRPYEAMIIED